jgi:anti-sigma-K factor RskA
MNQHHEYRDELAAFALGALHTPEKLEVERHVAGCDECREYLEWLDPAVDLLPASVEPLRAPPAIKKALMAEVASELKAERRSDRDRARAERGLFSFIWRPVTAGVLGTVLIAGALVGYSLRGDDGNEGTVVAAEPQARIGAAMEATVEVHGDEGTLHVVKLPGLGPNQDYQAWIEHDGVMEASSTFDVREDGEVVIEGSLEDADGVHVTREPEGGSEQPTSAIIMSAELPS